MLEVKTYKNWKEVCVAMNWNSKAGGNTKKRYLKIFDSICEYTKEGNKYIVTNVFEEQKEVVDKRKNKNGLTKELEYAILKILLDQNEQILSISKTYLMSLVGLINSENYYVINSIREKYAEDKGIDVKVVNMVLNRIYTYATNYLLNAIKNLERKSLVFVIKDIPYVNVTDKIIETDKLNKPYFITFFITKFFKHTLFNF